MKKELFFISALAISLSIATPVFADSQTETVYSVCKGLWEDLELKTSKMSHSEKFGDSDDSADSESHYEDVIKNVYSEKMSDYPELAMGDEITIQGYVLQTLELPTEQEWQANNVEKAGAYRVQIAMDNSGTYPHYDEFSIFVRSNDPSALNLVAGEYITINGIFLKPDAISSQDYLYDCSFSECPDEPEIPLGKQNALKSARTYLEVMPLSYDGLVRQLTNFDHYSEEEARYGADYCGVSWNVQAAKAAQNYLDIMSFSRDGLIQQLETFDGYTADQADYAATEVGY